MMKIETKQAVDYWLGTLLLAILRPIVYAFGILLKRDHDITPQGPIAYIKLQGGGSLLIAYPALLEIAQKYPHHRKLLVTTPSVAGYARLTGLFDEILLIEDSSWIRIVTSATRILIRLWKRVDTVIDLEAYSRLSTTFGLFTAARNRVAFSFEDTFLRKRVATHLVFFNRLSPVYEFYDQVAFLFGVTEVSFVAAQRVFQRDTAKFQLSNTAREGSYEIVVAGTCSTFGRERMLTAKDWSIAFSRLPSSLLNGRVAFLGTQGDHSVIQSIISEVSTICPHALLENLAGKTSLENAVAILRDSKLLLGIDSGLVHVARLLGVATTTYWGPTDPHLRLRDVNPDNDKTIYNRLPCSPCIHVAETPPCGGNNLCIQQHFRKVSCDEIRSNILICPSRAPNQSRENKATHPE